MKQIRLLTTYKTERGCCVCGVSNPAVLFPRLLIGSLPDWALMRRLNQSNNLSDFRSRMKDCVVVCHDCSDLMDAERAMHEVMERRFATNG
jgi:hypothetical protein